MVAAVGIKLMRDLRSTARSSTPGTNNPPLSAACERLREQAIKLVQSEDLAQGSWCYNIVPLERTEEGRFRLEGETLDAPRLLPSCGQLTALACAACTLGPRLESTVSRLFRERKAALAATLDALGNELLMALDRRVQDRMLAEASRQQLTMAGELRAGDPGLELSAQSSVLRLAGAARIGLQLHGGGLLTPLKSLTVVMGVGRDLPATGWSRCEDCRSQDRCRFSQHRSAA
jgi:hypothetical protein